MAFDDDKSTASDPDNPSADEQVTADEWDAMVADQKGHASRHESGGGDALTLGNLADMGATAIIIDTDTNQPAAGTEDRVFIDETNGRVEWDDGGSWNIVGTTNIADTDHAASDHEDGGSLEISVEGLSGDLADAQDPKAHASSHGSAGSDTVDAGDLGGSSGSAGQLLATDGSVAAWQAATTHEHTLGTLRPGRIDNDDYNEAVTTANTGTSYTIDLSTANYFELTLTGDVTLSIVATGSAGNSFLVRLVQDGTGGRTVTWPASVVWGGGNVPAAPSDSGDVLLSFVSPDGGTTWYGMESGRDFA